VTFWIRTRRKIVF